MRNIKDHSSSSSFRHSRKTADRERTNDECSINLFNKFTLIGERTSRGAQKEPRNDERIFQRKSPRGVRL